MANLLYNGVSLPIIPAHDASYGVEVIVKVLPSGQSIYGGAEYILAIGKRVLWQNGKCYVGGIYAVYRLSGDKWVWHYGSGTVSTQDIVAANYFEPLWTNTDIPNANGNGIYLAATEPVDPDAPVEPDEPEEPPVEPEEPETPTVTTAQLRRAFSNGFILGMQVRGMFKKKVVEEPKEAEYYLYGTPAYKTTYNGVELPELPGWNVKSYPVALIFKNPGGHYFLYTGKGPVVYRNSDGQREVGLDIEATYSITSVLGLGTSIDMWGNVSYDGAANIMYGPLTMLVWTNTPITNADGSVYLPDSEPVKTRIDGNIAVATSEGYESFNGVALPKLPEWDKATYPYAYIMNKTNQISGVRAIALCASKSVAVRNNEYLNINEKGYLYAEHQGAPETMSEWPTLNTYASYPSDRSFAVTWTNANILDKYTNDVFRYAVEPIPLASSEPIRYDGDIPIYERLE